MRCPSSNAQFGRSWVDIHQSDTAIFTSCLVTKAVGNHKSTFLLESLCQIRHGKGVRIRVTSHADVLSQNSRLFDHVVSEISYAGTTLLELTIHDQQAHSQRSGIYQGTLL